ncbi:MAG TPA: hypothetical protein VMU13_01700 [Candidatus Paceibacterota bacterium]|nr:hypothetical protein [Candidatus Paceibacterota bacterium]
MAKKPSNKKNTFVPKDEDGFDRLARIMKEGFDDVETNLRKEISNVVKESEGNLRTEIQEVEERLQYRIAKVATDVYRHLEDSIDPQIQNHDRRIKRLEGASKI